MVGSVRPRIIRDLLPYFTSGQVVVGFGRGGKKLGCPTANLDAATVQKLHPNFACGVYYGFASVDNGSFYRMVMSIGWNPHFHNSTKSMEVHLLHTFEDDFYGSFMKVAIIGFIREMTSFSSLDELMKAIKEDISEANEQLARDDAKNYENANFSPESISIEHCTKQSEQS